ncbi:MAG: helix-turn-helix domain-containing protein [Clostridiales Family XIII bacterium]|jgi:transcriptional regulator with XRE-family HTH domain|nr:helix-turn-helix domain-containing protein [Clostridiales Family XIII bacterium]
MKYNPEQLRRRICGYRKANNLTLEDLGKRINKSKTTVWKYENGQIDIDIETLFEISDALNVSAPFLLESSTIAEDAAQPDKVAGSNLSRYYMYFFDGHSKKPARSLIIVAGGRERESTLFYHLKSFTETETCRDFYTGQAFIADPYINFVFQNANNPVEKLFIVAKEPFKKHGVMKGILTGISYKMFQPISFKVLISIRRLSEDEELWNWLKFSKEDLAEFRKHNSFTLTEDYDSFKPLG